MKLRELAEARTSTQKPKGSYAGLHLSEDTQRRIKKFIDDNKIPNGVPSDKLHTTLIYSRKFLPAYKAQGELDPPWVGTPKTFHVWKTQPTEHTPKVARCLVLEVDCEDCIDRHEYLMKEHGATFDFDKFTPHITLSYDIGDEQISRFGDPKEIGDIEYVEEYGEDLNPNWAEENA
jgi:hypothetical protein